MDEIERLRQENEMLRMEIMQIREEREKWSELPAVREMLLGKLMNEKDALQIKAARVDSDIANLTKLEKKEGG